MADLSPEAAELEAALRPYLEPGGELLRQAKDAGKGEQFFLRVDAPPFSGRPPKVKLVREVAVSVEKTQPVAEKPCPSHHD